MNGRITALPWLWLFLSSLIKVIILVLSKMERETGLNHTCYSSYIRYVMAISSEIEVKVCKSLIDVLCNGPHPKNSLRRPSSFHISVFIWLELEKLILGGFAPWIFFKICHSLWVYKNVLVFLDNCNPLSTKIFLLFPIYSCA